MIGRYNVFKDGKSMSFTCENETLLKKYEEILKNISKKIDKEFSSIPTSKDNYGTHIKTKIHETKTSFYNNKVPRRDTNYMCSSIIRIESVYFKLEEFKYYPQAFLEACRHEPDNGALRLDET